jgi:ElaB/YqjD/DUF883 family membrane-anchored ribosome-binding protein
MKTNKSTRHTPKELLSELQALVAEAESMMADSLSEHSAEAFSKLRERFGVARERFTDVYDDARRKVSAGVECTDATIRANPYQSLAIALGVGLITGVLVSRRSR